MWFHFWHFTHPWFIPSIFRNPPLNIPLLLTLFVQKFNKKSDQTLLSHALSHACSSILNRELTVFCLCKNTKEGDPRIRVWEYFGLESVRISLYLVSYFRCCEHEFFYFSFPFICSFFSLILGRFNIWNLGF